MRNRLLHIFGSLRSQETAPEHTEEIIRIGGLTPDFIQLLPVLENLIIISKLN